MLATIRYPRPPPGPAANQRKYEEKLDDGLNTSVLVRDPGVDTSLLTGSDSSGATRLISLTC